MEVCPGEPAPRAARESPAGPTAPPRIRPRSPRRRWPAAFRVASAWGIPPNPKYSLVLALDFASEGTDEIRTGNPIVTHRFDVLLVGIEFPLLRLEELENPHQHEV